MKTTESLTWLGLVTTALLTTTTTALDVHTTQEELMTSPTVKELTHHEKIMTTPIMKDLTANGSESKSTSGNYKPLLVYTEDKKYNIAFRRTHGINVWGDREIKDDEGNLIYRIVQINKLNPIGRLRELEIRNAKGNPLMKISQEGILRRKYLIERYNETTKNFFPIYHSAYSRVFGLGWHISYEADEHVPGLQTLEAQFQLSDEKAMLRRKYDIYVKGTKEKVAEYYDGVRILLNRGFSVKVTAGQGVLETLAITIAQKAYVDTW